MGLLIFSLNEGPEYRPCVRLVVLRCLGSTEPGSFKFGGVKAVEIALLVFMYFINIRNECWVSANKGSHSIAASMTAYAPFIGGAIRYYV